MRQAAGLKETGAETARQAVGYCRVSTTGQADEGVSLQAQEAAIRRWAEREGVELLDVIVDAGVSGAVEVARRPGLLSGLELLRAHKGAVLVAHKRDRIARDVVIAATVERMAAAAGGGVVAVEGATNGHAPEDVLMRTILDAFAQFERALIAARTRTALAHKKAKGERVGELAYGTRLAADGLHVEVEEAEARVVSLVSALRADGMTLRAIVTELESRGVLNRKGRPHTLTAVARMAAA